MNDHIKGIRSKIQELGGFRVSTTAEVTTLKSKEESFQVTTKKPVVTNKAPNTNKPEKPLTIDNNEQESVSITLNGNQNVQMATTHDVEHETVEVNAPPAEASIAEAKPIGR